MNIQHPMAPVARKLFNLINEIGDGIRHYNNNLFTKEVASGVVKIDGTPVTKYDTDINTALAEFAKANDLGFIGEEGNGDFSNKQYVLLVDPIDGTGAFRCGMNTATIIVTIMEMRGDLGAPVISFIHEPIRGVTWIGALEQRTQVVVNGIMSGLPTLNEDVPSSIWAYICSFPGASSNLEKVKAEVERDRRFIHQNFGAFGISAGLIASRIIHVSAIGATSAVEAAAMKLVVEGVGGVARSLEGAPLPFFRIGTVRGKTDFELPRGAIFAANKQVLHKVEAIIMMANAK